ncbi:MAG: pyridoxal-phosphate dependent enzyme [Spirochaetota bacterium]|nr:pyridoxal-phosphate dependent enzyme [Spirochaetota bacterium]
MSELPNLSDVFKAAVSIKDMIRETPFIESPALAAETGAENIFLKLESLQNTGAFKVRGASNKILNLDSKDRERGVITFSTGNHGKAVSFVAGKNGIKAVVCLSENVPAYRAEMIRSLGAEVVVYGKSQDDAEQKYYELIDKFGYVPVVPFDDPAIISGQGTVALEMLKQEPDLDVLLVPLSGGGLLSGVAMAAKEINPGIHIVGVSIERSPAMLESLKAGKPVAIEEKATLADSLLGGIGQENYYTLQLIAKYADEHIVVTEKEIERGMFFAFNKHSLVIEGAAAVGIGAALAGKIDLKGKKAAMVISGSTIDQKSYIDILNRYSE